MRDLRPETSTINIKMVESCQYISSGSSYIMYPKHMNLKEVCDVYQDHEFNKSFDQGASQVNKVFSSLRGISEFSQMRQCPEPPTSSRHSFISDLSRFPFIYSNFNVSVVFIVMHQWPRMELRWLLSLSRTLLQHFHNFLRLLDILDLSTETLFSVEGLGLIEEFNQFALTLGWAHLSLSNWIEEKWLGQIGCQFTVRTLWTSLLSTGFDPMIIHFSGGTNDLSTMLLHVYWYEHPNWRLFGPGLERGTQCKSNDTSVLSLC